MYKPPLLESTVVAEIASEAAVRQDTDSLRRFVGLNLGFLILLDLWRFGLE